MNEKVGASDHESKDYAVTVNFKNLPNNIVNAEVLFENRQLVSKDNSFVDSFDPIGTHIYRLELK